jgi:hypothetical protein
MTSEITVKCELIKDGKHLIGIGLNAPSLDEMSKGYCKKIHTRLTQGTLKQRVSTIITVGDNLITFNCGTQISFIVPCSIDESILKTILHGDQCPLNLWLCPHTKYNFEILIEGMETIASQKIGLDQKKMNT